MNRLKNEIGNKYGRLTVIKRISNNKFNQTMWLCECNCGNRVSISRTNLTRGNSRSCGCLKQEILKEINKTHGMVYSSEYSSWLAMKNRVRENYFESHLYFDRGIRICNRWLNSFENFYKDMGKRPKGYTLDRIDNNGNYEPNNCRWSTPKQQANNQRNNHLLTLNSETYNIKKWSNIIGIDDSTISARLKRGWSIEKTLTTPLANKSHKK